MEGWFGLVLILIVGGGFAAGNLFLSQFLGPSKPSAEKSAPYECGMPAVGDARERMSVKFYLVAMVFLLFDIEVAFLYPWALAHARPPLGRARSRSSSSSRCCSRASSTSGARASSTGAGATSRAWRPGYD